MTHPLPRFAAILLALALTVSGGALGSTRPAPTLPGPTGEFGSYT